MLVSIAPMLDVTDRHFRYFMRQISKSVVLYTEMIVADAIIHGDQKRFLEFDECEHPIVVQLGGSDPDKLTLAAKICAEFGYDEINLNVGCPSDRVKSGKFGACLMKKPQTVSDCVSRMLDTVLVPVTVKHRIGLGKEPDYSSVRDFVGVVSDSGCKHFIVHARNAILEGLSPKQNREIPPLKYDYVYKLKQDFPDLLFTINGGIKTIDEITQHLQYVDGVMVGREAYHNPYSLINIDQVLHKLADGEQQKSQQENLSIKTRAEIANNMLPYLEKLVHQNVPLHRVTKHMIGLYHGCPHAKSWRHTLTEQMIRSNDINLYKSMLDELEL